ncbi:hypothetical protein D3C73_1188320 [compost metagenome]
MKNDRAVALYLARRFLHLRLQGLQGIVVIATLFASRGLATLLLAVDEYLGLVGVLGVVAGT